MNRVIELFNNSISFPKADVENELKILLVEVSDFKFQITKKVTFLKKLADSETMYSAPIYFNFKTQIVNDFSMMTVLLLFMKYVWQELNNGLVKILVG